jgi:hypothetical protein
MCCDPNVGGRCYLVSMKFPTSSCTFNYEHMGSSFSIVWCNCCAAVRENGIHTIDSLPETENQLNTIEFVTPKSVGLPILNWLLMLAMRLRCAIAKSPTKAKLAATDLTVYPRKLNKNARLT